ncbi:uncharacterized protein LOC143369790 [Andrena cerasifolii]|uniref:uncharacterized protein LOC143369790 n=1 Tax=Andrena cerasifolii TaxID=2819439 RepID=UPI004037FA2F
MCDHSIAMELKKEAADARNRRYWKGDAKVKQPTLSAKRLSKNTKRRERQRLKTAACLTVGQGTMAEAGTHAGTSNDETLASTSAAYDFIHEEDVGNFQDFPIIEGIVEQVHFDTDAEDILEEIHFNAEEEEIVEQVYFESNEEEIVQEIDLDTDNDEIHSVRDINEETTQDVGSDADYWVVENAEQDSPKIQFQKE